MNCFCSYVKSFMSSVTLGDSMLNIYGERHSKWSLGIDTLQYIPAVFMVPPPQEHPYSAVFCNFGTSLRIVSKGFQRT